MPNQVEEFNWEKNMSRVSAGFKGGPFFKDPNIAPAVNVGEGFPKEVEMKMKMSMPEQPTPVDVWATRGKK